MSSVSGVVAVGAKPHRVGDNAREQRLGDVVRDAERSSARISSKTISAVDAACGVHEIQVPKRLVGNVMINQNDGAVPLLSRFNALP